MDKEWQDALEEHNKVWPDRNQSIISMCEDLSNTTGNTSGKALYTSSEESRELLGGGGGGNIGNEEDKSDTEHLFGVAKRKRKEVIELNDHSSKSDSSAFEDAPKKEAKKEVLKKKEEKKSAKKKDCSFKLDKEKRERLKLLEESKMDIEGKT
eukprot:8291596-Ditylum_brightwellii.AAC.1